MLHLRSFTSGGLVSVWFLSSFALGQTGTKPLVEFDRRIEPILAEHCYGCHAEGSNAGNFSFEAILNEGNEQSSNEHWFKVLKKLQAGLMPPAEEEPLSKTQLGAIENWIKYDAFGLDPLNPDPGRVTIRRLNQVEYRNSVRDLLGVDYDTSANFPSDDTGHGFDNIGEVLSMSPLLLEKYVNAAKDIVSSVVPVVPGVLRVKSLYGDEFELKAADFGVAAEEDRDMRRGERDAERALSMSYYSDAEAKAKLTVDVSGVYVLRLNLTANETYVDNQFDANSCELSFSFDGEELLRERFVRQSRRAYVFDFERTLTPGRYDLVVTVTPTSESPQIRRLRLDIESLELIGPSDEKHYVRPDGYEKFFPGEVPTDPKGRRKYATELLGKFATRAFRRPVDQDSLDRLVRLAESIYTNGGTFESGVAKSMTAVLASPRFLFREESWSTDSTADNPLIDEYALASRLSYFLWSTMPDDELTKLAKAGELRNNLDSQIDRMLAHEKAAAFTENFVGQWLRARAIGSIQINTAAVLGREPKVLDPELDVRRQRFFALFRKVGNRTEVEEAEYVEEKEAFLRSFRGGSSVDLSEDVRTAMRLETEMLFSHILKGDRSLLELIDSNYTFLNEALWSHYQIEGVEPIVGDEMRLVDLPANSLRGGVLTQGTTLVVTSNPDRTSPVKRGLFILENLLGTPPAAPPPNIPALEDVKADEGQVLSLRETLAIHRKDALCSSCHQQMDPLGLALENFNAMGRFRTEELDQTIDAAGALNENEQFSNVAELKRILVTNRKLEIYRCVTEKMMTYALGRAVEYTDSHTVDQLVDELEEHDGRIQTLVRGIIRSNAFQRTRARRQAVASK